MTRFSKISAIICASAIALLPACAQVSDTPATTPTSAPSQSVSQSAPTQAAPSPASSAKDPALWRSVDPERLFIFETTKGRILIEAFPDVAPNHVKQFTTHIKSGLYDGTPFHRVIDDFMAQGGDIVGHHGRASSLPDIRGEFTFQRDPKTMPLDAFIGPKDSAVMGYLNGFPIQTKPEFFAELNASGKLESYIPHCRGVVSTARTSDPNSANAQFFLMREHSPHLDRQYTAWGRVVDGEDRVKAIKHAPGGAVRNPDVLVSARVAADLPASERPRVWVLRTDSDAFKGALAQQGELPVCSLTSVITEVEN